MTEPLCDVCESELAKEDAGWRCACRACDGTHFCCVPCVAAWGRQIRETNPEKGPLGKPGVWAVIDLCPDDIRATAALMGLDLPTLSRLSWEILKGAQSAYPEFGTNLRSVLFKAGGGL